MSSKPTNAPATRNTITLYLGGSFVEPLWMASHSGPHAQDIKTLFGTTRIPTSFYGNIPIEVVRRHIAANNPEALVVVQGAEVHA